jgi:hypothetical protein
MSESDRIEVWIKSYMDMHTREWKEVEEIIRLSRELGLKGYTLSGTDDKPAFFSVDAIANK